MIYGNGVYSNPGFYQAPNLSGQYQQNLYNGMQSAQQPLQQMQNNNMMQIIKGRPVSSFEEAKASMIDLDGSLFVFTDVANKKIYTKQIMLDGTAELKTYSLIEDGQKSNATENETYVLKSEFEKAFSELQEKIENLSGGLDNESNNESNAKSVRKKSNV